MLPPISEYEQMNHDQAGDAITALRAAEDSLSPAEFQARFGVLMRVCIATDPFTIAFLAADHSGDEGAAHLLTALRYQIGDKP